MKIKRYASVVRQGNLTLYTTSLKVRDLLTKDFYNIERLDPENADGYQRVLNKSRAKKFADYILTGLDDKGAFLPTSIFMATEAKIPFNSNDNTITIDINKIGSLNIVDGQHRVEGFKIAYNQKKDERILDFEVPVNIAIELSIIEQMTHFLIVNTTQKSVDAGVSQRINARLSEEINVCDNVPHLPKWILNVVEKGEDIKALKYVDFLNDTEGSIWNGKINMAHDDKSEGSINQKSFVNAIKNHILVGDNPILNNMDAEKQHKIFLNYWTAITNIIGKEKPVVLFKTTGVELFTRFYVSFLNKLANIGDYQVPTMQTLLKQTFDILEGDGVPIGYTDFWTKGSTASGLNASKINKTKSEMLTALNKVSNTAKNIKI